MREGAAEQRWADRAPQPLPKVHTEGTLPHQGIYDVSLERITSQYLAYLETFQMLNIEVASEFIVMAANLMYIKSRTLLPVSQQPPEEDAEEDDPRWELIRQLVEYKKFKDAAAQLAVLEARQEDVFPRVPVAMEFETDVRSGNEASIFDLLNAADRGDTKQEALLAARSCELIAGLHYKVVDGENGVVTIRVFAAKGDWEHSRLAYTLDDMVTK